MFVMGRVGNRKELVGNGCVCVPLGTKDLIYDPSGLHDPQTKGGGAMSPLPTVAVQKGIPYVHS